MHVKHSTGCKTWQFYNTRALWMKMSINILTNYEGEIPKTLWLVGYRNTVPNGRRLTISTCSIKGIRGGLFHSAILVKLKSYIVSSPTVDHCPIFNFISPWSQEPNDQWIVHVALQVHSPALTASVFFCSQRWSGSLCESSPDSSIPVE